MCLPVDSVFEFSQIGHHGSERWSFSKEHRSPVLGNRFESARGVSSEGIPNGPGRGVARPYRAAAS